LAPQAQLHTGPTSPVSHWPLKLSCTLAPQAQYYLATSSLALSSPKPSFTLAPQAQFYLATSSLALFSPSLVSHWPLKPSFILPPQAYLCIALKPSFIWQPQA